MADIDHIATDSVLVPRHVLDSIAEALASIVQVSGQSFGVLLDRLDSQDGDNDAEDDPAEQDGTEEGDQAWIEWNTMRGSQKRGANLMAGHEDAEDDDPREEDDPSGQSDEDGVNTGDGYFSEHGIGRRGLVGPGCPISDPGGTRYE